MSSIEKEKEIIKVMIRLYCKKKHRNNYKLCNECEKLLDYSYERLDHCIFGEKKISCKKCPLHCYKQNMKKKIKEVMRFSGPRIVFYRPYEFFKHIS